MPDLKDAYCVYKLCSIAFVKSNCVVKYTYLEKMSEDIDFKRSPYRTKCFSSVTLFVHVPKFRLNDKIQGV